MAMRQIALQMVKYPNKYYKYVEYELLKMGESYDSFCYNVFHSNVWGDDLMAAVIGDMWNIAITILSPVHKHPMKLFHNKDEPDVIIVANGGSWMGNGKHTTHFNGSHSEHMPLVGLDLINPNLMPQVLDSAQQAKQLALKNYLRAEEAKSLDMLRTVTQGITRLDNHIADLIHESDSMKEQKKTLEFQMEQLGISVEKIKEAGLLADRPYVRTLEREAQDAEKRRRQLEEEEQQKERQK